MELALITVVSLHLMAVNLAGAGPLVAAWAEWRGTGRSRPELLKAARRLVTWSMLAALFGVGLGFAAWAELAYWPPKSQHSFRWLLQESITADRWRFIIAELAFYFVCIMGCLALWKQARRRWLGRWLLVAAATNLLYHFPPLFTIIAIKFEQHNWSALDHRDYLNLLLQPATIARILHVWLASFATAGLTLSWIGVLSQRSSQAGAIAPPRPHEEAASQAAPAVAVLGGRWALWATMLQIPVGVWILFSLPDIQGQRMMTGSPIFAAGVIAALALMHQLATLSLGDSSRRRLSLATLLLVLVILLMTAALEVSRPA